MWIILVLLGVQKCRFWLGEMWRVVAWFRSHYCLFVVILQALFNNSKVVVSKTAVAAPQGICLLPSLPPPQKNNAKCVKMCKNPLFLKIVMSFIFMSIICIWLLYLYFCLFLTKAWTYRFAMISNLPWFIFVLAIRYVIDYTYVE